MKIEFSETPRIVAGVRLATVSAGVKTPGRKDLTLIAFDAGTTVAGVFTRNAFCAAPVTVSREHLVATAPRLLVVNSGNANAGTGSQGHADAREVCAVAAREFGCATAAVLPFSTGVIGQRLPVERILNVLPEAVSALAPGGWDDAAHGIMTTDTVPKCASVAIESEGFACTITGIAKGAGMIKPDMATMLGYVATDAAIATSDLQAALAQAADRSFNRITIDGDTSTNDSLILAATGAGPQGRTAPGAPGWEAFVTGLEQVCESLARAIVRDGEGATKLVKVSVVGGRSEADCLKVAYAVGESPLVKTALFAGDPNWGRILAATGRSGVAGLDISKVSLALNDYFIVRDGEPAAGYEEKIAADIMKGAEYDIVIDLGAGPASAFVLTCDFSYDYVKINAEYRS